jgi:protein gp37
MADATSIEWASSTWSPWLGCTKVSAACDFCYAEAWAKRAGHPELWAGERRRTSASYWQRPLRWDREAAVSGTRLRIFPSLCDPFDNQVPSRWRDDFWHRIDQTPHLDWLLLTKRPQNIPKMLPNPRTGVKPWGPDGWSNVWLGTTAENQEAWDRNVEALGKIPAQVLFVSVEPMLGLVDCGNAFDGASADGSPYHPINWVIAGGESGSHARPMHPAWARSIRDQCIAWGVPFLFKQWGGRTPKAGGRLLDGREWDEYPTQDRA